MPKELEFWQLVVSRITRGESVILLVVAGSTGSSPGRAGYKMAVAEDGTLAGSIGGGVMEVSLVEQSRAILSAASAGTSGQVIYQVHQKNAPNASGMICSGKQTVILRELTAVDEPAVNSIINAFENKTDASLTITPKGIHVGSTKVETPNMTFEKHPENDFVYTEKLGPEHKLFIIGGGHCALALSELMSHLDFRITIFDDRPELNTIVKNQFADEIKIIDKYEKIGELIPSGSDTYVVTMTLGYKSDEVVIRQLFDRDFKYFGVLGSKAKMKTLLTTLNKEGFDKDWLGSIHTPIGLPINSHTPEEIAVSIAAEIIAVKNS